MTFVKDMKPTKGFTGRKHSEYSKKMMSEGRKRGWEIKKGQQYNKQIMERLTNERLCPHITAADIREVKNSDIIPPISLLKCGLCNKEWALDGIF